MEDAWLCFELKNILAQLKYDFVIGCTFNPLAGKNPTTAEKRRDGVNTARPPDWSKLSDGTL